MPTASHTHDSLLRLGGRARLEAGLADWIAAVKAGDPLRRVVVVTGSSLACGHLARVVAARLGAHAGVRFVSIHSLARELAGPALELDGLHLLTPLLRERLVASLSGAHTGADSFFGPVARTPGLPRALTRSIDDLREAGVPPAALGAARSPRVAALAALYGDYVAALQRRRLVDDAGLYALAAGAAGEGRPPLDPGTPVAVYGLYDLPAMQAGLIAALPAGRPLAAFVPWGAGVAPYAAPARAFFEGLGLPIAEPGAGADQVAAVSVLAVTDDVAQRRAACGAVLRAAAGGVAFHDMAVLVHDASGRAHMAAALAGYDVPVAAHGPAGDVASRTCRLLLDCLAPAAGRALRRDTVIDLAATAPRLAVPADAATVALWDDLSRRARIVADDEWLSRLGRLERAIAWRAGLGDDGDESAADGGHWAGSSAAGDAGRAAAAEALAAAASLRELVARLAGLRRRLVGARSWPQAVKTFLDGAQTLCGVAAGEPAALALAGLADLRLVDDGPPGKGFAAVARRALEQLETPAPHRVGRDGVAVLSPQQVRGLSFRQVVFCDLAEGGFPPRPAPDPILLDRERVAVAAACGARLPLATDLPAEHDALFALARQAATERLVLVYPRLDATNGRPRLPSRVLLDLARELTGRPVSFDELERDGGCEGLVQRAPQGRSEPLDLRDVDLGVLAVAARRAPAVWLRDYAAAVMGGERAERGAAAGAAGRRPALGPYDGVLAPDNAARAAARVLGAPVSPSALETYLACPFQFYLRHVLGLDVPDEPDDALSIEPRDLGSLVHEILQAAYGAAADTGAPTVELAVAALEQAAPLAFDRAEARGLTGFPLAWRVLRDELLADLRHVVETDPCWRDGVLPVRCEWSFGGAGRSAPGDAADVVPELVVGDRVVRFRGRVDRVDASADGGRVRLVDYKTGAGTTEAERLDQGRDVQLAVYVLAALAAGEQAPAGIAAEYRMVRRGAGFKVLPLVADPGAVRDGLAATVAVAVAGIAAGLYPRWHDYRRCRLCDAADRCGADRFAFVAKRRDPRLRGLLSFKESRGRRTS